MELIRMKEMKKEYNKVWWGSVFSSLVFLVMGILLIIKPAQIITGISIVVGIGIIIAGIFAFLRYFRNGEMKSYFRFDLIYGVICVLAGTLLILNPQAVASILPLVLGIWMIINSIIKIQYALTVKQYGQQSWLSTMVIAIITLAFGILFVFNPFKGMTILTQILGAVISIYAVLDIVNSYLLKKKVKDVVNYMNEAVRDVKDHITTTIDDIPDAVVEETTKSKKRKSNKKK